MGRTYREDREHPKPIGYFQRRLDADPELRARCDNIANALREDAREERVEIITAQDLGTTINARTEDMYR